MLEQLADYDDELMEQLLDDMPPPRDKVFDDLAKELRDGLICPVLLGSAESGNGIFRLLKALRHEAPFVDATAQAARRRQDAKSAAQVLKTFHTAHGGKLSLARVLDRRVRRRRHRLWRATATRSASPASSRCSARSRRSAATAEAGERSRFGRLEQHQDRRHARRRRRAARSQIDSAASRRSRCSASAIAAKERKDEVKLTAALAKIIEEDPSLSLDAQPGHAARWCCGGRARCICASRWSGCERKYGIDASDRGRARSPTRRPSASRLEVRGRHKKQSRRPRPVRRRGDRRSSRCRAARASSSPRRSPAASCRSSTSRRSRSACSDYLQHGPLGLSGGRRRGDA